MAAGLLDLAAQAGGVDEAPQLLVQLHQGVHRVDGGAGDVVDDAALLAGHLVEQRGLAHVRPADQGHAARAGDHGGLAGVLREGLEHLVEDVGAAAAVQGGDGPRVAEAERVELGDVAELHRRVDLVGHEDHRHLRALQLAGHDLVGLGDADLGVDHDDDDVGGGHRTLGLAGDGGVDALDVGVPATGVLHPEAAPGPLGQVLHAVAGDAGGVLDDGLTPAEEAVDQGGLAHVRPAHHRDGAQGLLLVVLDAEGVLDVVPVGAGELLGVGGGEVEVVGAVGGGVVEARLDELGLGGVDLRGVVNPVARRGGDDFGEPVEHLVGGQLGGVDGHGVVGRAQRRGLSRGVCGVAALDVGEHGVEVDLAAGGDVLVVPALGAHLGRGGQVHLRRGVGEHDGADVATLDDGAVGALGELALQGDEVLAHLGDRGDRGDVGGDLGAADLAGDVLAGQPHGGRLRVVADVEAQARGLGGDGLGVGGVDAGAQHGERGDAVHGTGVDVLGVEALGERPAGGRLAGAGGAVDGEDQAVVGHVGVALGHSPTAL